MTNKIWSFVDNMNHGRNKKIRLFLLIHSLLFTFLGLVIWIALSTTVGLKWDWGLCIVLLFLIYGYAGGLFYIFKRY